MAEAATASGVERIADAFASAREEGRAALMPYLMGGFPDAKGGVAVAEAYAENGADLIELGIPFSDPLADGPVIHAAATAALDAGATLETALEACSAVADRVPVVAMAYSNMILAGGGAEAFAKRLASAGAAGAIVPDLPLEESESIRSALSGEGLALVPLVAPTTPAERRRAICESAEGFVYVVSTVGVTGERAELPSELTELIEGAKSDAGVPVAVGFGIGTAEQAASVGSVADGVIVGSKLVRLVSDGAESGDAKAGIEAAGDFVRELHGALAGGSAGGNSV
jgi:tryptophan synthase alpha chain